MRKKIKLFQHMGKYEGGNEYTLMDEDLELYLDFKPPFNSQLIATISNGDTTKRVSINGTSILVKQNMLNVGLLKVKVEVLINERLVQTFNCEDLIVKCNQNKFELIPEIEALKQEIAEEKAEKEKLVKKIDKLTQLVSGLYRVNLKEGSKNE